MNEINIRIAEICGTHSVDWNATFGTYEYAGVLITDKNGNQGFFGSGIESYDPEFIHPLKYDEDLNSMHLAEKMIPKDKRNDYTIILDETTDNQLMTFWMIHATAKERADAFLELFDENEK